MAIPDYQSVMLILLKFLASDNEKHHIQKVTKALAKLFELSQEEQAELLPSGRYPTFKSRISWAGTYMKEAELVERCG